MNNYVHSALQEQIYVESERKETKQRKNTQNTHNNTTIHEPLKLERLGGVKFVKNLDSWIKNLLSGIKKS